MIAWDFVKGRVVVMVGPCTIIPVFGAVVEDNVVVSIQPPNQPYLTQDVVGNSVVDVDELVELVVVVSSKQPANISYCTRVISDNKIHTPPTRGLASFGPRR